MNYIQQLQADKTELIKMLTDINEVITDLTAYLQSSKFHHGSELDNYVNTSDVLGYLQRMKDIY
mgnify:CR=1 FL=1